LTGAERALMTYVEIITHAAARSTHADVQRVRDAGWTENQIAEAVYITAMFAFFNRVADAFGVAAQDYLGQEKMTP
jgi:alkylhydroperoxidase family enzyme